MIGENSTKHHYLKKKIFILVEDITDANYTDAKRICKDFEIKNVGEYDDLYVPSNTLLLADVFENFRNIRFKIYELDPAKFL